ncbi:MAG: hypothetical protein ACR2O6_00165 [Ilumatobacteraceae bacterium]
MPDDRPTTRTEHDDSVAPPEIVMFFLGPDGEPVEPEAPGSQRTLSEIYRSWRASLDDEREHGEFHRRRPPDRKVQGIGRPGRTGYRDEIVVTLRADPMQAVTEAVGGDLFDPPITRLEIDPGSLQSSRYELSWRATIRVGTRRRAARVRLYASPSLNVSVLSLLPARPRSIARTGFLRVGLRVMNQLRDRIDERVLRAGAPAA